MANKAGEIGDGPIESLAARNVVDGLALVREWENKNDPDAWKPKALSQANNAEMDAIKEEINTLNQALDSVSDLLMAESVFQHVIGNTAGARSTLDSLSKGNRPPEPSISAIPRGGPQITHRIGVILGGTHPMENRPWDQIPVTPRAQAEPYLNGWVGKITGRPWQC